MAKLNDFFNDGFGWVCRHCDRDLKQRRETNQALSHYFLEGEAESKSPELSNAALAKWADAAQSTLMCPRCGITEAVDRR